ncbi:MAG: hypothetical protein JO274_11635 [Gammaproteobacteria bacterium]|nr:hypothetical protein [Gammaproteobacteria bacterium]
MPFVRGLDVALVLWPSFLAACGASLLFFAAVDPALLRDAGPRVFAGLEREAGYALGFLFFWAVAAVASALSVYLIRTARTPPAATHAASDER